MKEPIEANSDRSLSYFIEEIETVLHIIPSGFSESRRYIVVHEDAYKQNLDKTAYLSSKEIKEKYNITL